MGLRTIATADAAREPWANGLGWTRELARVGGKNWTWRLSLAESSGPARFSHFEGVERLLVLVRGRSLTLAFDDGESVTVSAPGQGVRFSGARPLVGTPARGTTEQLNLMWRPSRVQVDWSVINGPTIAGASLPPGVTRIWHVLSGNLAVDDLSVGPGTTVIADESSDSTFDCIAVTGIALEISLTQEIRPEGLPSR